MGKTDRWAVVQHRLQPGSGRKKCACATRTGSDPFTDLGETHGVDCTYEARPKISSCTQFHGNIVKYLCNKFNHIATDSGGCCKVTQHVWAELISCLKLKSVGLTENL